MKDLAIVTVFFEYPEDRNPLFFSKALEYFEKEDIYIARFDRIDRSESYYEKLCRYKIEYLLDYLKEYIQGKYECILFMDALDVNFYRNPKNLVKDFKDFGKSIVFCGEKEQWPIISYSHRYETKEVRGFAQYLNSGLYIGHTDKVITHLENLVKNNYPERITDQSLWTIAYLLNDDIAVDQECKLFFSTHTTIDLIDQESSGRIVLKGLNPYLVHDNGPYGDSTLKITHLI